jgi:hypothetical protein
MPTSQNPINRLSFPLSTVTCTRKEWQDFLKDNDPNRFIQGYLYNIKVKSIGGGMLQAYLEKFE